MRTYLVCCRLLAVCYLAACSPAHAQVNLDGRSTEAELKQIRDAVNAYVDRLPDSLYRSNHINWSATGVTREDIDGKPGLEAIVHIAGDDICGVMACDNAIVVWRKGQAWVIDIVNDSMPSAAPPMSHGMYDLVGHYHSFRWDGRSYHQYCRPENVCD